MEPLLSMLVCRVSFSTRNDDSRGRKCDYLGNGNGPSGPHFASAGSRVRLGSVPEWGTMSWHRVSFLGENKIHKHQVFGGVKFKNEKRPRHGSPGLGFECRPLNGLSFFAENPFPATPGPGEAQPIPNIAPKVFHCLRQFHERG